MLRVYGLSWGSAGAHLIALIVCVHCFGSCALDQCRGHLQAGAAVGDGTRDVDALLEWPGGRLAVEVDGPHHFTTLPDTGEAWPTGATQLRDAELRRWGLDVLSVPVADRSRQHFRSASFQAELMALLRSHGVPIP